MKGKIVCNWSNYRDLLFGLILKTAVKTLILISGPTCSGKSFLLAELANKFPMLASVGGDAYFRDINDPVLPPDGDGWFLFDVPEAYRGEKIIAGVRGLLNGYDIFLPDYNIRKNKIMSDYGREVRAGDPIAVDFLFAIKMLSGIHKKTIKIYLDTDQGVCLARRIKRDTKAYGIGDDLVRKLFHTKIWPSYQPFIEEQRNEADLIIK